MKKKIFFFGMVFALALSACSGTAEEAVSAGLSDDYENAISVPLQLLAGTLKLEETDLAVDAAQAEALIPLWQVYGGLIESGSAAPEETDALLVQIQETMSAEQIEAIAEMRLTLEDTGALMQAYGLTNGSGSGETPPEGVVPGSGRGSDLPGTGSGSNATGMTPEQIATAQAERESGAVSNNRLVSMLLEGVIELLQSK
jgi:hypothetical protein